MRALVLLLSILLVPGAAANEAESTLFLHQTGACEDGGSEEFNDATDSTGDLDGCGFFGTAGLLGEGFPVSYPGRAPLGLEIASGAKATHRIFVVFASPDQASVASTITAGQATCGGDSGEKAVVPQMYTEFTIQCDFSGAANATVMPEVAIVIKTKVAFGMGYEGSHASRVLVQGTAMEASADPAPAPSDPGSDTPGLSALAVLLGIVALAGLVRRRQ